MKRHGNGYFEAKRVDRFNTKLNTINTLGSHIDKHGLGFCVCSQGIMTHFSPHSGLFRAAERSDNTCDTRAVDADNSCIHFGREAQRTRDILGKDTSHETKSAVVSFGQDLFFGLEGIYDGNWTKNLLIHYLCVVCDIGEYCWLDIETLVPGY